MKTISAGLQTHINGEVTTLCTCWEVTRRDGQIFRFTDLDVDLTVSSNLYRAALGYNRSNMTNDSSMAVDNLDLEGVLDSEEITAADLRAGKFDFAQVKIFMVNYKDLTQGVLKLRRGWIGEVSTTNGGTFKAELRGMTQVLTQRIGEVYSPECRADLGDTRCKVNIQPPILTRSKIVVLGQYYRVPTVIEGDNDYLQETFQNRIFKVTKAGTTQAATQPTYNFTVGVETTDGTAKLTAEEAWMRHAVVATVTNKRVFTITVTEPRAVDDWFNYGAVIFETGNNEDIGMEIKDWVNATAAVTLFLPMPYTIQVGDKLRLYPGCDKRNSTCDSKFANTVNFRGEPYVPGQDELFTYPDAQ